MLILICQHSSALERAAAVASSNHLHAVFSSCDCADPYLKFFALRKDGATVDVHKTETIPNNLNPVWNPV